MLDYNTTQRLKTLINKKIDDTKEHICYGVDSFENLMYARGRLSGLESLLQDINNLHKEDNDDIDKT
jgi:hypothetical protein|tara:strand:+ start:403 stop:603 length:201 start_codon:yes stop_codon:yes gene_type:complete